MGVAHASPGTGCTADWADLNTAAFLPQGVIPRDFVNASFPTDSPLRAHLTGPGIAGGGCTHGCLHPPVAVYNQSASILGYTSANLVATTRDAARWFWDLVGPSPKVLPPEAMRVMTDFRPLDKGWMPGVYQYGAGLMLGNVASSAPSPPEWGQWGSFVGHPGQVLGFESMQGYFWGLNASLSVASNNWEVVPPNPVACAAVNAAAHTLHLPLPAPLDC